MIELTYSNNGEPTNQDVVVTLTANEPIQKPGNKWTAVEGTNGTQWTAVYSENYEYRYFKGTDLAGNKSESVWFKVEGIDKVVPEAVVTYETQEDGSVVVFIKADEAVTVSGEEWEVTDVDNQFKKSFTVNGEEVVTLTDTAGNISEVTVTVDTIVEDPCAKCHGKVCVINAVPATCTTKGYTGDKVCKVCDKVICKGVVIPALGHHYVDLDCTAVEPTCTEAGKEEDQVCILCGDKIPGKEIKATGHSYVVDETTKVEPTCTEPGKEADQVCKNCGDVIPGKEIPALGHSDDCGHDDGNDDITGGNGDDGNGDDGDDNVTGGNGDDEKNDDVTGVDDDDNRDGNRGKNDDKSDEDGSPKTGDSANIMGCIYAMAMAVAAVIAVIKKRRA